MDKESIQDIINSGKDFNNLPNSKLVEFMDRLSTEFESTKKNIISLTYHLDNVEALYDKILKVYEIRKNGK